MSADRQAKLLECELVWAPLHARNHIMGFTMFLLYILQRKEDNP